MSFSWCLEVYKTALSLGRKEKEIDGLRISGQDHRHGAREQESKARTLCSCLAGRPDFFN